MRASFFVGSLGAASAAVMLACGGSNSASLFSESRDAGAGNEGSAAEAGSPETRDSGAPVAVDSGMDAARKDPRILPLALGRRWTYENHALAGSSTDCVGSQVAEVLGKGATRDGRASLRYHALCFDNGGFAELEGTGDKLIAYFVDASTGMTTAGPFVYIDAPVAEGHEWDYGTGAVFAWHEVGTVTVPAGTFSECWRRDRVPANGDWVIYCRGVGQVKHHYESDGFEAVLTAINF